MSKHFYKDVQVIKICKVPTCLQEYRPERGSFFAELNLCHKHRTLYYRNWYINKFLPWFKKLPEVEKEKYRKMKLSAWKKWVSENLEKRRKQALESYHRNKHKHGDRKHRKVVT